MGEFTRTKLRQYHISWEGAHLLVARSCMCYISICLKHSQGSALADISSTSSKRTYRLHPMSQQLLDYALDDALDHFGYLGSKFESAVPDVTVLAEDIRQHSEIWDRVYILARWGISTKPRWPAARHDLLLYILVAFAPNSFMSAFFRDNALKPKEGTNPLVYAAHFNKDEHARTLLSRGAKLHDRGWETRGFRRSLPIEVAFRHRHYVMITHFVEEGSTVPPHIFTDSFFHPRWGDSICTPMIPSSIARILVQTDDFAEHIHDGLNEAALHAMKTSNQLLVFQDPTEEDFIVIVRRFIQVAHEHSTSIREAFLLFAIAQGYFSAARYLLTLGTPLPSDLLVRLHHHSGVQWKTAPMIRFLIDNGADVLVHASYSDSLLHAILWAPSGNNYSIVDDGNENVILGAIKLLVGYGCDPLEADSHGNTPLHIAVERGYTSVARYLLILGAPLPPDPLVTFNREQWRWDLNTAPMIRFLVECGVHVLGRTSDGGSALHTVLRFLYDDDEVLETVKLLVGYGCDPLAVDSRGNTPLRIAVERGHISAAWYLLALGAPLPSDLHVTLKGDWSGQSTGPMIRFLFENGVDVVACANDGNSLLHTVLQSIDDEIEALEAVKLLVGYGCNALEANSHGNTPLQIAVKRGHISAARYLVALGAPLPSDLLVTSNDRWLNRSTIPMIRFLVDNGADVLACAGGGGSLLHVVLQSIHDENECLEAVKLLVGYGCHPLVNSHGNTLLHIAVQQGHISVVRYLVDLGAPLPPDLFSHVSRWTTTSIIMIRFLVENGADVPACANDGNSLLHAVLHPGMYGNDENEALETVKLLVGYGCDPLEANSRGDTPLHIAVERGLISVARYLLTLGAPPDLLVTFDHDQLQWSSTAPMIRFLVDNGVDVRARASDGESMLHIALQSLWINHDEALEIVKLLVSNGYDPLEANFRGNTPLHIAVEQGHIPAVRYLLTLGAPLPPDLLVTLEDYVWCTTPMLGFLVEHGVNVLTRTSDGDSLFHTMLECSRSHNENVILERTKLLVGYGCNPLEPNSCGNAPLQMAVEKGYISTARYLLTLGATVPPDLLVTLQGYWSGRRVFKLPMIHFLIENGLDVLARSSDGDSALHIVLQYLDDHDRTEIVKLLVDYGCNPLEANCHGNTPLHIAVERDLVDVARYLATLGAPLPPDLLVTSNYCRSRWRHGWHMIPFLVDNGVNVLARASNGNSLLHTVLQSINDENMALEAVKLLVGYGCNPLEVNSQGNTPLHIAVERGHTSAARYLITLGAHLPPDLLVTLQAYWSDCSTLPMIHFLVENGVDVLAHTSNGDSLLHTVLGVLEHDDVSSKPVKFLVYYGCNPFEPNSHGNTPLHIAVERGLIHVARYLVTLGASLPPDFLVTLKGYWSDWSKAPMLHFLVENGVDVHARASNGDCALHIALQCFGNDDGANLEAVKVLVGYGCDPLEANSHGSTPLHIAVEHGHISAARYLLTLGAPLTPDILVTLNRHWSCWSTASMIRLLVKNGVDVHAHASDGDSVLHIALRCFNDAYDVLDAVKLLVSYGCDPLEANSRGETPLHITAERSCVPVARYLITQGASVLTKVSNGNTVLHFAAGGVYLDPYNFDEDGCALEAIKFLVGCGCEPAAPNDDGETPLHIAVDLGRIKTIKYLLSLNIPLPSDILFTAIESDDNSAYCRYIIATLVTSGCDARTPNADGDTPLRVAIMKGKVDVVAYLLSVVSVHDPPLEDLLSATALAPPSVQSEMRRVLSDRRTWSESPDSPTR
jgi:ankyrin repeat protein